MPARAVVTALHSRAGVAFVAWVVMLLGIDASGKSNSLVACEDEGCS